MRHPDRIENSDATHHYFEDFLLHPLRSICQERKKIMINDQNDCQIKIRYDLGNKKQIKLRESFKNGQKMIVFYQI